jgi:ABC-type glycerol-3-phosphate transport system substrate-binding protein
MDPVVLDAIKYFATIKKINDRPEDINKHPYQVNEDFYWHGLSVFYIGSWYGIIQRIDRMEDKVDDYCVLPFPTSTGKTCSYGGGTVLAVSSKSVRKEEAWNFVQYLTNDDFMEQWAHLVVHAPAFEGSFWQQRYTDERVRLMYEQTVNSKVYPLHPAWLAIENELVKGIGYTIFRFLNKETNGGISTEDYSILAETDERIRRILEINQEVRYLG